MYEGLVKSLRWLRFMFPETHPAQDDADRMSNNIHLYCTQAANAIEELQKKYEAEYELRVKAFDLLCEWCAVCPLDKRDAATCEIANISEPQEEEEESS